MICSPSGEAPTELLHIVLGRLPLAALALAERHEVRTLRRGELLAEAVAARRFVAICGSHGKTSTCGLLVAALASAARLRGIAAHIVMPSNAPQSKIASVRRNGGLTSDMKKIKNGEELWKIVDPCPEEW